jgi:transketolase
MIDTDIELLKGIANQLRIHSITATTAAGSGHPTSCCSAADIVAALFFSQMRYDAKNPHYYNNDRFILSKGHAAPLLYAAWAENGFIPVAELATLRQFTSELEGHPTPRLAFADVATGSLGQGLGVGAGIALAGRLDKLDYNTYVLLGDGEIAEGAVWEAASLAGYYKLNNLIAIVDANRLGQSEATAFGHDISVYAKRFEAFGWRVESIDGHDIEEIIEVLQGVGLDDKPLAIIAKTYKGAGVSFLQDKDNWHGKPLNKEEAAKAIAELAPSAKSGIGVPIPSPSPLPAPANAVPASYPDISYKLGDKIATREAAGVTLARIGEVDL